MTPAIFDMLAFSFALKFFIAWKFFLFQATTAGLNSHLQTLRKKTMKNIRLRTNTNKLNNSNFSNKKLTVPHFPLWHLSAHS
jgi:uncharacterized membrane protein